MLTFQLHLLIRLSIAVGTRRALRAGKTIAVIRPDSSVSNRRSHPRLDLATPTTGSLRVVREVRLLAASGGELMVVSASPAVVGEAMLLDVWTSDRPVTLRVLVAASRPVIVDDVIKHEIRLSVAGNADAPDSAPPAGDGTAS